MARSANKKTKTKQRKFRDAKKKMQRVKLQEKTRIPNKQYQRWATSVTPLDVKLLETECDPSFVAFCILSSLGEEPAEGLPPRPRSVEPVAKNEFVFLWLKIAHAIRLGMYTVKEVDRNNRLRLFDQEMFDESIVDKDYEAEYGLRYEADKFLCYLVYGNNPRFRDLFGYILIPDIENDLGVELPVASYNTWIKGEPTAPLAKSLAEFDIDTVE